MVTPLQRAVCSDHGVEPFAAPPHLKVGISENVKAGVMPVHGLRHPPEGDTTGWYIWAGEATREGDDYFKPLHVEHFREWSRHVQKFLALPPGWRFLTDGQYVDVWFDPELLDT